MAITKLNSLAIPANTVVAADLSYPLTNFSSTGIDDNADATAITIDSSERVMVGTTSPVGTLSVNGAIWSSSKYVLQRSSGSANLNIIEYWNGSGSPLSGNKGDILAIGNQGGDGLVLVNGGAEIARVTSNGLKMASGLGIDFSATSDASGRTSELLDDYEEGTWTPTSVSNISAIANANGHYTKIGNVVTINFFADITPSANSSYIALGGLPFSVNDAISGSNVEATGVVFEDSNLYMFFALGSSSNIWIEYDRPIQGSSDTLNRSYRGSLSYFH